jgi:hypothetical protein
MSGAGGCRGFILSHALEEVACCLRTEGPESVSALSERVSDLALSVAALDRMSRHEAQSKMLELAADVYEASAELLETGWLVGSLALEGIEGRLIETFLDEGDPCPSVMSGVRVLKALKRQAECTRQHESRPLGGGQWVPKRSSS